MNNKENRVNHVIMRVNWILPSAAKTLMNSTQNLNQLNIDESLRMSKYYTYQG